METSILSQIYLNSLLGVVAYFAKEFGFTADETVALMGAHTLGSMHPNASGFSVSIFFLHIYGEFTKIQYN